VFPSLFGCSFSSSRLFSGSRVVSRKKPATIRQQQQPTARATNSQQPVAIRAAGVAKRVDPAALPLGSTRSRTQIAFSPQRGLALAEIHGVESPKRGAEFHFPQICTTPIRNACFLHKWPSGLTGGGGVRGALGQCCGLQHGAKKSLKTCNCRNFQGLGLQKHETVVIFSA
jgi:hypothetical protein